MHKKGCSACTPIFWRKLHQNSGTFVIVNTKHPNVCFLTYSLKTTSKKKGLSFGFSKSYWHHLHGSWVYPEIL